jgi:hypothetical protein
LLVVSFLWNMGLVLHRSSSRISWSSFVEPQSAFSLLYMLLQLEDLIWGPRWVFSCLEQKLSPHVFLANPIG